MAYTDTRQKIIDSLMGRPAGTEIQPEDHQEFALSLLDYIRTVELMGTSALVGVAYQDTDPIQPYDANVSYIAACPVGSTVTFTNFHGNGGTPLTYTCEEDMAAILLLTWNTQYWELTAVPSTVIISDSMVNYLTSIRKTYSSYASMLADTNPTTSDGKKIREGQLVSVVDGSDASHNGIYSRTGNGWTYQSSFNYELVQTTGDNPNVAMSQKAVTEAFGNAPKIEDDSTDEDLDISDEQGHVLVKFSGGHIKTKNFDSKKVNSEVSNGSGNEDLDISDEQGHVLVKFSGGHIKTKNFDSRNGGGGGIPDAPSDGLEYVRKLY